MRIPSLSLRARQGGAAISTQERMRLLRFARNDIQGHTSLHWNGVRSIEGALTSNIIGISRSLFHGSLEMTSIGEKALSLWVHK